MTRHVRFEDEANAEYREAGRWYESRREGLGIVFFYAVDAALSQILDFPRTGAMVPLVAKDLPVRRLAVKRFPYHVVYLQTYAFALALPRAFAFAFFLTTAPASPSRDKGKGKGKKTMPIQMPSCCSAV